MPVSKKQLRKLLSQLALSIPSENYQHVEDIPSSLEEPVVHLLQGRYSQVLRSADYTDILFSEAAKSVLGKYPASSLQSVLSEYTNALGEAASAKYQDAEVASFHLHVIAIALLQTFIQVNFTGPAIDYNARDDFFAGVDETMLQNECVQLLNISGQQAYELMVGPLYFILSECIFENLVHPGSKLSILDEDLQVDAIMQQYDDNNHKPLTIDEPVKASIQWWMSRALQVHLSVLFEPASVLSSVSSLLLNPSVANSLAPAVDANLEIQRNVQLVYYLECARTGIHNQTEHLSIPLLGKAKQLSRFSFILSGAKAKRTKFQKYHNSALLVLAQSEEDKLFKTSQLQDSEDPESFELNSDLLLEKPIFESLEDLEIDDETDELGKKRIKLDFKPDNNDEQADNNEKLLPIAFRTEDIPTDLRTLDPNNQPGLSDLDNLQLLLRLTTLKQTSPSGNALVEEELQAIVSRILYANSKT